MLHPEFPLKTARLRLRPQTMEDLEWQYDLRHLPEVFRYLPFGGESRDDLVEVMEKRVKMTHWTEEGGSVMLIAEEIYSGARVGEVCLFSDKQVQETGEIGYILHPDYQGKGYAAEAAREMLRLGFDDANLHRIVAKCNAENKASLHVMLKLGMRQEGIARSASFDNDEWCDLLTCAMLESEWKAQQAKQATT